jgi:hypothetical protein
MARVVAINAMLLVLPFLVYAAWRWLGRVVNDDGSGKDVAQGSIWAEAPWTVLFVTGTLLVFVTMGAFASCSPGNLGGVYIPPHVEDGKVVPGVFKKPDEAKK